MNEIQCYVVLTSWWTHLNSVDVTFDLISPVGPITMHLQLLLEVVPPEKMEWERDRTDNQVSFFWNKPGLVLENSELEIWYPELGQNKN